MLQRIFYLALAGGAGTLARYYLATFIQRNGAMSVLGTATVNITGCLAFGLLWALAQGRFPISPQLRIVIFVGFFGAFTTFSTFVFETNQLLESARWLAATSNCLLQNALGLIAIVIGLKIGTLL
jgi:CrcB protein